MARQTSPGTLFECAPHPLASYDSLLISPLVTLIALPGCIFESKGKHPNNGPPSPRNCDDCAQRKTNTGWGEELSSGAQMGKLASVQRQPNTKRPVRINKAGWVSRARNFICHCARSNPYGGRLVKSNALFSYFVGGFFLRIDRRAKTVALQTHHRSVALPAGVPCSDVVLVNPLFVGLFFIRTYISTFVFGPHDACATRENGPRSLPGCLMERVARNGRGRSLCFSLHSRGVLHLLTSKEQWDI